MLVLNVVLFAIMALVIRVSSLQGHITCGNGMYFYVDGTYILLQGDYLDTSTTVKPADQVEIADDSDVLSVMCWSDYAPHGILASFDNGVVTDSSWRCTADEPSSYAYESSGFDDSQWNIASELGDNGDATWGAIEGVSSSAKWIWSGDSALVVCRLSMASVVTEDDGEVTPEGCKYRGAVHPAGEVWIQEVHVEPQRQRECTCPDPLPATWSAWSGGCEAACVKEDGIVHYGGDQYQRTVDGAVMECKCNPFGRERCS